MNIEKKFFTEPALVGIGVTTILANGALWWFLARHVRVQPETIPVHYNIYFGIDLLGSWWYFYLLPAAALFVLFVNIGLAAILYHGHRLASYFLVVSGLLIQGLAALTAYHIITKI